MHTLGAVERPRELFAMSSKAMWRGLGLDQQGELLPNCWLCGSNFIDIRPKLTRNICLALLKNLHVVKKRYRRAHEGWPGRIVGCSYFWFLTNPFQKRLNRLLTLQPPTEATAAGASLFSFAGLSTPIDALFADGRWHTLQLMFTALMRSHGSCQYIEWRIIAAKKCLIRHTREIWGEYFCPYSLCRLLDTEKSKGYTGRAVRGREV